MVQDGHKKTSPSIHPRDDPETFKWPDKCYHFCTRRSNDLEQGIVDLSSRSDPQKTPGNSGSESLTNDLGLIGSSRCTKHCASFFCV